LATQGSNRLRWQISNKNGVQSKLIALNLEVKLALEARRGNSIIAPSLDTDEVSPASLVPRAVKFCRGCARSRSVWLFPS
ncbi:MAG: hypothetical protein ABSC32_22955, partial [Steroidobacteraceae bacterium]